MICIDDNKTSSNYDVAIIVDDENRACFMELRLRAFGRGEGFVVSSGDYPNAAALSADFRCRLGYGDAVAVLEAAKVPKTSRLWALNNHGE